MEGIGVDKLDRIWCAIQTDGGATHGITVFDPNTGANQIVPSTGDFVFGHWQPDSFGRMWLNNGDTNSVEARSYTDAAVVASVLLDDSGDEYLPLALLFDPMTSVQDLYVVGKNNGVGSDKMFVIDARPGSEAVTSIGAGTASLGGFSSITRLVRDPVNRDFWFADINAAGSLLSFDASTFAASRVPLSKTANGGIRGLAAAFGFLWIGTDTRFSPTGDVELLKVDPLIPNNVRGSITFPDAIYIADIAADERYIYATIAYQISGVENRDNKIVKIDPFLFVVVEEAVTTPAGESGTPQLIEAHVGRTEVPAFVSSEFGETFTYSLNTPSPSFRHPTPVLAEAEWWFHADDFDTPVLGTDGAWRGAQYASNALIYMPLVTRNSPYFGAGKRRRVLSSSPGFRPSRGRIAGKTSMVLGSQGDNGIATMANLPFGGGFSFGENTFLHDGTGMTFFITFRPFNGAPTLLFTTASSGAYSATDTGFMIEYNIVFDRVRVAIANGSGSFVHEVISDTGSIPDGETFTLIVRYKAGNDPEFTVDMMRTISAADGFFREPVRLGESALPTGAPAVGNPTLAARFQAGSGTFHVMESAAFMRDLSDREVEELFLYQQRWYTPWDPEEVIDMELWLRSDHELLDQPLADNSDLYTFVLNDGTGPGETQVSGTDEYNVPLRFEAASGEEPASALMPGTTSRAALFDRSTPTYWDATQTAAQFRWLTGGGAPGGGEILGMTLVWVFRATDDSSDTQSMISTSTGVAGTVGLNIEWRGVTGALRVSVSNAVTHQALIEVTGLSINTTYTCTLQGLYTAGTSVTDLNVNGVTATSGLIGQGPSDTDPPFALRIGGKASTGAESFSGYLPEVIGFRRRLGATELTLLKNYLDAKWK
jgi:hypothetical protein